MLFELPLSEFLQYLYRLHRAFKSGMVMFFAEDSRWGKVYFNQGDITVLQFGSAKGWESFSAIAALERVQFHFREEDTTPIHTQNLTEEFFVYFDIRTPAIASREKQTIIENTVEYKHHRNAKILIADDSSIARKALSRILIDAGFTVLEAKDGIEAVGIMKNDKPDLVFLDVIMPGVDGYQVLEMVDRNPDLQTIPIVMLTSRDSLLDKVKGKMSKCDAYLTKPVPSDKMLHTVYRFLE